MEPLPFGFRVLKHISHYGPGVPSFRVGIEDESLSSDGASDLEREDMAADDLAQEEARKAGIPELELDALPSASATKFLPLT